MTSSVPQRRSADTPGAGQHVKTIPRPRAIPATVAIEGGVHCVLPVGQAIGTTCWEKRRPADDVASVWQA
jgi:hypothetical protein